jgi:hypothetical protein
MLMNHPGNSTAIGRPGRRTLLQESALCFGTLALNAMLAAEEQHASATSAVRTAHHPATAKHIIFLFMSGGPGQTDTFDPKPVLQKLDGQRVPDSIAAQVPDIPRSGVASRLMASPFRFSKHGQSGIPVSELFPHTAQLVDELCLLRSLSHRNPVHGPAECLSLTGTSVGNRPSMGAWISWGLGSDNRNLPSFLTFLSNSTGPAPQRPGWNSGFLPAQYQGTAITGNDAIPWTAMPTADSDLQRRQQLDFLDGMNREHLQRSGNNTELAARINSFELSFRMQTAAPEVFDLSGETASTRSLYGLDNARTAEFGRHCLLARRLIERGVRCVQLRNGGWDAHGSLESNHLARAAATDQPVAALLQDLRQRGLLDDTLVVWGGEFGRTPTTEGVATGRKRGRDHSPVGYTMWLAGGGVQGGRIIGETDELGYVPVQQPLLPADLHATLLYALGLDQHRLAFAHRNRDEIPTVLGGNVIHQVFA